MDAELTFDSKEWQTIINRLKKKWDDILIGTSNVRREFSTIAGAIVYSDIIDHFENEKGPKKAWDSWSTSYTDHMNKIGRGGNKILQYSGDLRKSIVPTGEDVATLKNINEGVMFYSNIAYAAAHQYGYKNIPARPFLWISNKAMDRIVRATTKWMAGDVNG